MDSGITGTDPGADPVPVTATATVTVTVIGTGTVAGTGTGTAGVTGRSRVWERMRPAGRRWWARGCSR